MKIKLSILVILFLTNNATKSVVEDNDITFNDFIQTQYPNVRLYAGIRVASFNRAIISANYIINN